MPTKVSSSKASSPVSIGGLVIIPTPTIVRSAIRHGNIPNDSPRNKNAAIVTKMGLHEPITAASAIVRYFKANNTRNRFVQPIDARN